MTSKRKSCWLTKSLPAVLAVALTAVTLSIAAAEAGKKVGVITWNDVEPRYAAVKDAILSELKKEGFTDSNIQFLIEDAKGKKELIPALIKKLQVERVDAYVALGTSAAVPVAKEIKDKPVVFGMVYNPVEAKIIKDWKSSGNNVTGASNYVSIENFLHRLIKRSVGTYSINKLVVIFTPGEKNSELQLEAARGAAKELQIEFVEVPLAKKEDVAKWAKKVSGSADLIYVSGSNVVGTNIAAITKACIKAKIPTATHLDDLVDRGVLFGLVVDPVEVGSLAGKALAKVLHGAAPDSIPIEIPLPKLVINQKTADAGGFAIPPAIKEWAQGSGS